MTKNERTALIAAIELIAKLLLGNNTRADWVRLAGLLRIVLDKDYPIE
jgi:hypothetical protein